MPSEYIDCNREHRKKTRSYYAMYLGHKFFKRFKNVQFFKRIRPRCNKGDSKVTDFRASK